ncbi:MAG: FecR domain-containing protein [Rhodospirillales bacterium]|nr:FecR domain-containing protein [Rhodospirillales bacterium]MBO6786216.1 FecR domain-containing protein [Rhodospirillales bacterium]
MRQLSIFLCLFVLIAVPTAAQQQNSDIVAKVSRIEKAAVAMQDALPRPLDVGSDVQLGDIVSTGKDARLELTFTDGTTVQLGERAQFSVVEFVLEQNGGNAVMRLMKGAFSMTSGSMMQLADASMVVETDTATIGIRGTTFWGGTLENDFEVALLDGKGVYVETKAGIVELDTVGEGTAISGKGATPTAPSPWSPEKLQRAGATVAFSN